MRIPPRKPPQEQRFGRVASSVPADGSSEELPDYHRPDDTAPELPGDLTELDDTALVNLLAQLTRWQNFAARKLAEAQYEERRLENMEREFKADTMLRNWGGGRDDKVTIAEAHRDAAEEVKLVRQRLLDAYAIRKRTEARCDAFERDAFVVSRELTRRTKMEPMERRTSRWGGGQ